jgi:hypothetical protein
LQLYADGGYQLRIRSLEGTPNYGPRQYSKDVTFVYVPLFIICVRLGPSTPGVYFAPEFWTPKTRV